MTVLSFPGPFVISKSLGTERGGRRKREGERGTDKEKRERERENDKDKQNQ